MAEVCRYYLAGARDRVMAELSRSRGDARGDQEM
jgi:hypothetical protein